MTNVLEAASTIEDQELATAPQGTERSASVHVTTGDEFIGTTEHTTLTADLIATQAPPSINRLPERILIQRCLDYMRLSGVQAVHRLLEEQGILPHERSRYYRAARDQAGIYG